MAVLVFISDRYVRCVQWRLEIAINGRGSLPIIPPTVISSEFGITGAPYFQVGEVMRTHEADGII